jgi:hypothetical protein
MWLQDVRKRVYPEVGGSLCRLSVETLVGSRMGRKVISLPLLLSWLTDMTAADSISEAIGRFGDRVLGKVIARVGRGWLVD